MMCDHDVSQQLPNVPVNQLGEIQQEVPPRYPQHRAKLRHLRFATSHPSSSSTINYVVISVTYIHLVIICKHGF